MSALLVNAGTRVWLILVVATGLTTAIFEADHGVAWATIAILVIASVKIALIIGYFMEVRSAPRSLQIACGVWLVAVTAIVIVGFELT